jgi:hypothetical protein
MIRLVVRQPVIDACDGAALPGVHVDRWHSGESGGG